MVRRMLYGGFGIIALSFLAVVSLRCAALNAADASAGQKNGDIIARLESRIAALESRIDTLEKERASGGFKNIQTQPAPQVIVPPFVEPHDGLKSFDGNWCYTILIDGSKGQVQR
ncbi:MAG TPA: hypothetical protein VHX68_19040 [Planctomycetaceae bacterium]|nr:hypothetical protein [Planctomycetaceae bacterium]